MQTKQSERLTPQERWHDLKARGNPTVDEINAIDADVQWSNIEPAWWLEMMNVRRTLVRAALTKEDQS